MMCKLIETDVFRGDVRRQNTRESERKEEGKEIRRENSRNSRPREQKKVEFSKLSVHEAEEKLAVTPDWAVEQNQSY